MDENAIYMWDSPEGQVRVTVIGEVTAAGSTTHMSDSQSIEMGELPSQSGDMVRVKFADGPNKGRVHIAFRGELTPITDAGTGAHSA